MNLLAQEEMVQLTVEQFQAHIQELCLEKNRLSSKRKLMASQLGQEALARWAGMLEDARKRYANIAVVDKSDRDIVMAFVENRAWEKFITSEMDAMNSAESDYKALDTYHELCNSMLDDKIKTERRSR